MFLPATLAEVKRLGWNELDIILVTGDAYIDSPFIGVAIIGKILAHSGYRVGVIAQPDLSSGKDIRRFGEPKLFWGITAGSCDSMVTNHTALGKRRRSDDYTPGGANNRRPDRASIVYANLIRSCFKNTSPIVLGGMEASMRRIAHYDFWSDKIRKSILFDAKAEYLLYGMAERSVAELAACLQTGRDPTGIRGLCYISNVKPHDAEELPSYNEVQNDKDAFSKMFKTFYRNNDPVTAVKLAQRQDTRYLVQNPPVRYLSRSELDAVYELDYERNVHPSDRKRGEVRALNTIRFSITTHRGCYGECNFCSIAVHQGRAVRWRSKRSILAEARIIAAHPDFKGTIWDVGGPTANMYGIECNRKAKSGACPDKRCLFPKVCSELDVDHGEQVLLLKALREIKGVKKIVVSSGIRYDMVLADKKNGMSYLREAVRHHVSGQMKVAPEHSEPDVLEKMGKPAREAIIEFKKRFDKCTKEAGKDQYLTYYLIAAHPGCTHKDMLRLRSFALKELRLLPEQVQIFTPTPSTYSSLMYWTERDPFTGKPCFVEKDVRRKELQKRALSGSFATR
ncbi:MAG: YgiQ family radical SAM protein [Lentisphaerae bacterium]|nr:YgiQ family radical SAM protein [Lentisphaerota bacterium]